MFLDVDGTLAHRGDVPAGNAGAVRAARANGHLVLLCTGRAGCMVPERIRAIGFDGFVTSAGCHVELDGEVLQDRRVPTDLAARIVAVLDRHDVAYLLESPDALHGRPGIDERLAELIGQRLGGRVRADGTHEGPTDMLRVLRMGEDLTGVPFAKVVFFDSPLPAAALAEEIGPEVGGLPSSIPGMGSSAGELYLLDRTKAVGMQDVVERLGLSRDDVVAVGDGLNDLEMLDYAGIAVAIEGSDPRVLARADRTTPGPLDDGLVALFAELGLT